MLLLLQLGCVCVQGGVIMVVVVVIVVTLPESSWNTKSKTKQTKHMVDIKHKKAKYNIKRKIKA